MASEKSNMAACQHLCVLWLVSLWSTLVVPKPHAARLKQGGCFQLPLCRLMRMPVYRVRQTQYMRQRPSFPHASARLAPAHSSRIESSSACIKACPPSVAQTCKFDDELSQALRLHGCGNAHVARGTHRRLPWQASSWPAAWMRCTACVRNRVKTPPLLTLAQCFLAQHGSV